MDGKEFVPSRATQARHTHPCGFAALVLRGAYEEAGDAGRFDVREGDVILHGAFEAHCNRASRYGAVILHIALPDDADIAMGAGRAADPDSIARLAERSPADAAAQLLRTLQLKNTDIRDWPEQLAAELNCNASPNLAAWSHEHGIAPWTLSRGFQSVFGISPSAFRAAARARRAWKAIRAGGESLVDIANRLGFADQAHMSRAIRSLTGKPPRAWHRRK